MSEKIKNAREMAWKTRRKLYGEYGHSGSYNCGSGSSIIKHMRNVFAQLYNDGILSEGQAAKAMLMDRIQVRTIADNVAEKYRNLREILNLECQSCGCDPCRCNYNLEGIKDD